MTLLVLPSRVFNRKESGLFFTYSMIKLIFANNYSFCLGGPFFGRFYTADPNQRKKFESLHAVLCSIFNLSSSSFPDDHQFYYLQEINNCISAVKSNLVIKPITDDNFLPILSLDYFERSFISITRKFHLTLNMADSNSFITIFLGLGALVIIVIPVALLESLNIYSINNLLKSNVILALFDSIFFSVILVGWQDMYRMGRHLALPWFTNDTLQYDLSSSFLEVNSDDFSTSHLSPASPGPTSPYHTSSSIGEAFPEKLVSSSNSSIIKMFFLIHVICLKCSLLYSYFPCSLL